MKTAYIGSVVGEVKRGTPYRHLLLGGVARHTSAHFERREDAQAWVDVIAKTNREAGRKVGIAEASEVLVADDVELIPPPPVGPDPHCGTCHGKGCDDCQEAEAERWPMRGTFEVGEDMLVSLLVSAREGGSGYWCRFDDCPYKEVLRVGEEFGEWRLNLPAVVSEHPERGEEVGKRYTLNRAALQRGLDLLATKAPRVLASILRDDTDAEDADVFLQLCLFGEIVYG